MTSSTRALAIVAVAWAFLGAGLIAWARRPENRLGPLLTATGFALLARQLRYSHDPWAFTAFFALSELSYALAAHSVLAYPSGHVRGRAERALVRVGYASMLLFPLAVLLFYDASEPLRYMGPTRRESLLLVWENGSLAVALQNVFVFFVWGILATLFIALVVSAAGAGDATGAPAPRPALPGRGGLRPARRLRGDLRHRRPSGRGRRRRSLLVADRRVHRAADRSRRRDAAGTACAGERGGAGARAGADASRGRARRARARARRSRSRGRVLAARAAGVRGRPRASARAAGCRATNRP